ncbi:MAG: protein translocase subunit SecD [Elusimicrobiaceae bacterium]|nr:protein translocase subunit SecD [Elusimicrobiaceae bacterium]
MSYKLTIKWIVILFVIIGSVYLLLPTHEWYSQSDTDKAKLEQTGERPKNILNLGLDLRGGTYLLLELDVSKLSKKETVSEAIARAIEILRNRIDQYGVAETPITRQGDKWIAVQMPGISNPEQAEALIGKTAMLEFKIVKTGENSAKALEIVSNIEEPFDADGLLKANIQKKLPAGLTVLRGKDQELYVLTKKTSVTGANLEDARVAPNGQYGLPEVAFRFDKAGKKDFATLTGNNVGKNMAIILDNVVQTAPRINSRIPGEGRITGLDMMDEARHIAIVLRAGALPAPVHIIEKRTVGPGLGEDSIKMGVKASMYGLIFILVFMMVYYRFSGAIASGALILNLVTLLALMAYFGATLTLPGIAGIILSLAMAVDANVLILERIREEKLLGKPLAMAIKTGYQKAWTAIFDSNLTTWLAAAFLFQFGSGPVKGFAVTLTLGLLVGVFTSVFVTKAVYDFLLTANPEDISI